MRKLLVAALLAASAVAVPQVANATAYPVAFDLNGVLFTNVATTTVGNNMFDTFTFTLDTASTVSGSFTTQRLVSPAGSGNVVRNLNFVNTQGDLPVAGIYAGATVANSSAFTASPLSALILEPTFASDGTTVLAQQNRLASTDLQAGTYTIFTRYNVLAAGAGNAANYSGQFSMTTLAAVPEPATWAMMVGGFGLVGGSLRARRRTVRFA